MRLRWELAIIAVCVGCRPATAALDGRVFSCVVTADCIDDLVCDQGQCVAFDPVAFGQLSVTPLAGAVGSVLTVSGPAVARATAFMVDDTPALVLRRDEGLARVMVMPGTRNGPVRVVTSIGTFSSSESFRRAPEVMPTLQVRETLPVPSDRSPTGGGYGRSVSVDALGETIIAGRPNDADADGGAWVWVRDGGSWVQQGPKLGADRPSPVAFIGLDVALSAAGDVAAMGGGAYLVSQGTLVFARDGGTWQRMGSVRRGEPGVLSREGATVALSADGRVLLHGSIDGADRDSPRAWLFASDDDGRWTAPGRELRVNVGDQNTHYSWSTALDMAGTTALLSATANATGAARAWTFSKLPDAGWGSAVGLDVSDVTGFAVNAVYRVGASMSADGRTIVLAGLRLVDTADNPGVSLWTYARENDGRFRRSGRRVDVPGALRFVDGAPALAISPEGSWCVVAGSRPADSQGVLMQYARDTSVDGGAWAEVGAALLLPRSVTSVDISLDGHTVVVGTPGANAVTVLASP